MQVLCVRWDSQPSRSHSVLFLLCYQIFTFNVFIHANEIFCTRRVDLILSLAFYRLFSLSVWSHLNLTSGLRLYYKNSKCSPQTPQKGRHSPFPLGKKTNKLSSFHPKQPVPKMPKPQLRAVEARCCSHLSSLRGDRGVRRLCRFLQVLVAPLHVLFLWGLYLTQPPLRGVCTDACVANSVCVRTTPRTCQGKQVRPQC